MESNPLVSVIITCFNKGKYAKETIDSVLNQQYSNFEIVVINDGSTDDTKDVLDSISNPKVSVYHTPNKGVVAARNQAVHYSKGKYILPVDGDDLIDPSYMQKAISILESNANIGLVYCEADKFGAESGRWELEEFSFNKILETNPIHISAFFYRRDFDRIGGWNPNTEYFFEDWDFFLSIVELGVEVVKIPETLFHYRILPDSRTRLLDPEKTKKALRQIYLNHVNLYSSHFEDPLNLSRKVYELKKIEKEYLLVKNSMSYKVGRLLTSPLRLLRSLFS